MGEMTNPIGDAAAWARDGARHELEWVKQRVDEAFAKLERKISDLEDRVHHLEHGTKP
jgi:hypothetical protein